MENTINPERLEILNKNGELWFVISKDQGAKSVKKEMESPTATPEEHAVQQETSVYMQMLIGELKEEYRVAIILRELEGYSYEEIAEMLSCSLGTVKSRISRARQYLKERILADRMIERSGTDDIEYK